MLHKKIHLLLLFLLGLFCGRLGENNVAGTTTETQTGTQAAIEGLIVYSDSAPVVGANVILHDQQTVAIIKLGKRTAARSAPDRLRPISTDSSDLILSTRDSIWSRSTTMTPSEGCSKPM